MAVLTHLWRFISIVDVCCCAAVAVTCPAGLVRAVITLGVCTAVKVLMYVTAIVRYTEIDFCICTRYIMTAQAVG